MNVFKHIQKGLIAMSKLIRPVPPGYLPVEAEPRYEYLPESELPDNADELIEAGTVEPWRHDGTEQWYRIDLQAADEEGGDEEDDTDD